MATDDAEATVARAVTNYSGSAESYAEFWSPVIRSPSSSPRGVNIRARKP
jgi:hypothetical protein